MHFIGSRFRLEFCGFCLYSLGVTPTRQGHGIGSALLQPLLARADTEALPCYLETGVARHVGFYERQGFQVVAEGGLPRGGPCLWAMLRTPHRACLPPITRGRSAAVRRAMV
jgi:GNAT superfamily N-acetyltransferase